MIYKEFIFEGEVTNYIVYENGDIYNKITGNKLKPRISTNGYLMVHVSIKGVKKLMTVHKIVALAFISEKPTHKHHVNHKDGDKLYNYYMNLEWMTPKENSEHAFRKNLSKYGEKHYNSKYSNDDVFKARCYYHMGVDLEIISIETNIPIGYLKRVLLGIKRTREKNKFDELNTCSTTIERDDDVYIDIEDDCCLPEVKLIFIAS